MADSKKYYWLKLKEDFFEEDTINWLEEQQNGKDYCLFYLKLCLKSLKTDGVLIRNVGELLIPYDIKKLSELTNTDIDTCRVAMELFKKIGLIQVLENGEIYITQLNGMVGSETKWAKYKRENEGLEIFQSKSNPSPIEVQSKSNRSPKKVQREIEIEKEIEKDKNILSNTNVLSNISSDVDEKNDWLTDKQLEKLINENCADQLKRLIPKDQIDSERCKINFLLSWKVYPRKDGKIGAYNNYCKWINGRVVSIGGKREKIKLTYDQICDAVDKYINEVNGRESQYIKRGETFFGNQLLNYVDFDDERTTDKGNN